MKQGAPVRARIIDDEGAFQALLPEWWALLQRAAHVEPTRTPVWLSAWWAVFGGTGGREMRVILAEDERGQIVGIVPLVRRWTLREAVVPVPTLELMGSGEDQEDEICSEYLGPIAARGHEGTVARTLADVLCSARIDPWDELRMPAMDAADPMVHEVVGALRDRAIDVQLHATHECPRVMLPATWEGYLAGLGAHRRYLVRRTLQDLEVWAGPGGAALRRARDERELAEGWAVLQALHEGRWGGAGVFRSERFRRFHEAVMPRLLRGEGGELELLWLEVRGAPVAAIYTIVHDVDVQVYQVGRELDVPKGVRPGVALHLLAIRRAIELGRRSYDFLGGAALYKQQLALGEPRRLVTLSAVAPTLRARTSSNVRRTARKLVSLAREIRDRARLTS